MLRERGLRPLEALERVVELGLGAEAALGELVLHTLEHLTGHHRVRRNGADGSAAYPHTRHD